MKKVYIKQSHAIFEKDGRYYVTKRNFWRIHKWDGWEFSELSHAITSIASPTSSQGDYRYKLPKK
jgi:hypothetical protein